MTLESASGRDSGVALLRMSPRFWGLACMESPFMLSGRLGYRIAPFVTQLLEASLDVAHQGTELSFLPLGLQQFGRPEERAGGRLRAPRAGVRLGLVSSPPPFPSGGRHEPRLPCPLA